MSAPAPRIQRIAGRARGRAVDVRFRQPVTVLSGPTGSGKSTALELATWALSGAGPGRVRDAGDVFRLLGAGEEPLTGRVETDLGDVTRQLVPSEKDGRPSYTTKLDATFAPTLKKTAEVQGAVVARLGDVTSVDLSALLALSTDKRRQRLLALCAGLAESWTPARVAERVRHYLGAAYHEAAAKGGTLDMAAAVMAAAPDTFVTGEDFYVALAERAEAAHQAGLDNQRLIREAQAAVEELTRQAAASPATRDPAAIRAELAEIARRIEADERSAGEATQAAARRSLLETLVRDADALPSLADLEAAYQDRRTTKIAADRELTLLRAELPPPPPPDPEARELVELLETMQAEFAERRGAQAAAEARLAEIQATIAHLRAARDGACPTCRTAVGPEMLGALERHACARRAEVDAAARATNEIVIEVEMLEGALAEVRAREEAARAVHAERIAARRERIATLEAQTGRNGPLDLRGPEDEIGRVRKAQEAAAEAQAALADLVVGDVEGLRVALQEARARRASLNAELATAETVAERDAAYKRTVRDRNAAESRKPALVAAAHAWRMVVSEFGADAVGPVVETAALIMPAGWRLRVNLAAMDLWIDRDGVPPALVDGLSRGEQCLVWAALAVALASTTSSGLRVVQVDHAEAATDEPCAGDARGLFVALVGRLAAAVETTLIAQAILAHGRLTEAERAALASIEGVEVVRVGADAAPSAADVNGARAALRALDDTHLRRLVEELVPSADLTALTPAELEVSAIRLLVDAGIAPGTIAEAAGRHRTRRGRRAQPLELEAERG